MSVKHLEPVAGFSAAPAFHGRISSFAVTDKHGEGGSAESGAQAPLQPASTSLLGWGHIAVPLCAAAKAKIVQRLPLNRQVSSLGVSRRACWPFPLFVLPRPPRAA